MRLIIDKGNTRTKVAVYNKEELLSVVAVGRLDVNFIAELYSKYDITATIFSTVSGLETVDVMDYLAEKTQFFIMSEDLYLPIRLNYIPKYSLGNDRIAAIAGAYIGMPGSHRDLFLSG